MGSDFGVYPAWSALLTTAFTFFEEREPLSTVEDHCVEPTETYMSSTSGSVLTSVTDQPLECLANYSCSSYAIFLTAACIYLGLAAIMNLIACYKFVVAWNLISEAHRVDLRNIRQRRSSKNRPDTCLLSSQVIHHYVHAQAMSETNCPICLSDFFEDELVTSCDDGCHHWFHKECLFEWLDRSESCPCCRKDLLAMPARRGWFYDLSAFLGYA